jgi:hypothetical protein
VEGREDLAAALLARLEARALDAEVQGKDAALAWFDAGYFAASLQQAAHRPAAPRVAATIDAARWVRRALQLRKDASMELAASLMKPGVR